MPALSVVYDVVLKSVGLNHASFSDVPLLFANGKKMETGEIRRNDNLLTMW
jgi:hypothetical protein